MIDRSYTAAEVDTALAALVEPGRLAHAQDIVVHAAPTLIRVLAEALAEGGWFGEAHDAEVSRASAEHDQDERARAIGTLVAEQTRLGMFVGVAVGFELAHELAQLRESGVGEMGEAESDGRESVDGESVDGESVGGGSVGRGSVGRESVGGGSDGGESHKNQPSKEED